MFVFAFSFQTLFYLGNYFSTFCLFQSEARSSGVAMALLFCPLSGWEHELYSQTAAGNLSSSPLAEWAQFTHSLEPFSPPPQPVWPTSQRALLLPDLDAEPASLQSHLSSFIIPAALPRFPSPPSSSESKFLVNGVRVWTVNSFLIYPLPAMPRPLSLRLPSSLC